MISRFVVAASVEAPSRVSSVSMLVLVVAAAVGCGQTPAPPAAATTASHDHDHDHDHHDDHHDDHDDDGHGHHHPTTAAGAVEAIEERLASLEKAFADKDHDAADSLVHEMGHLLEDGEELLGKLPEDVVAKARAAWNDLGECLADVDDKLHSAGDDKEVVKDAYEAVKARIGSAMDSLRGQLNSAAARVEK